MREEGQEKSIGCASEGRKKKNEWHKKRSETLLCDGGKKKGGPFQPREPESPRLENARRTTSEVRFYCTTAAKKIDMGSFPAPRARISMGMARVPSDDRNLRYLPKITKKKNWLVSYFSTTGCIVFGFFFPASQQRTHLTTS